MVGLKEAKEIVEQYIEQQPDVKNRMSAANAESARDALQWLVIIGALGALAYYLFAGKL